jgi:hypothetical protein
MAHGGVLAAVLSCRQFGGAGRQTRFRMGAKTMIAA